jgi:hypothetical protein
MSKEPNGVLVMTTCKCRENNQNLVMTRTYFTEMLSTKVAWGAKQEQERIIQILEAQALWESIELIKGEN